MPIATINPTTGETLQVFEPESDAQIDRRLACAETAFKAWRRTGFPERAEKMLKLSTLLIERREELGRLMATEMGKPLRSGIDEAVKSGQGARYYVQSGQEFLSDKPVRIEGARAFIRSQPLGPVLAIMPWNFPFWQVIRFAAPALIAGNVGLLKHASNVPRCALALEELFRAAGFPAHVFQTLLIESPQVQRVLEDPRVAAVTLTGSESAGSQVAAAAGRLIKKTVLELGGSDPFIVMPSANLDEAVKTAVSARTVNNGQSCIAAKRFLIHEQVYEQFARRFTEAMAALKVGDPLDPATEIGPLATASIRETVHELVRKSVEAGARVLTGGECLPGSGFFYPPTVLAEIPQDAPVRQEEVFGPVASLYRVGGIDEAIELANATAFGLGASVWTADAAEQERFIEEIEAGQVFVNAQVASHPRLPFGGIKRSGYGRELGELGLREFLNSKTVWVKTAS